MMNIITELRTEDRVTLGLIMEVYVRGKVMAAPPPYVGLSNKRPISRQMRSFKTAGKFTLVL